MPNNRDLQYDQRSPMAMGLVDNSVWSLGMKMLVLVIALTAPTVSAQTTWYVDDVAQQGDGTGSNSPFNSIQYAINQSTTVDGDTIQVASGTYFENIDLSGKSIAIVGSDWPPAPTIIDGSLSGSTVRIASGEGLGTRLSWLTIVGGNQPQGGGLYCAGTIVQIDDCMILQNYADVGGGIFAAASDISIDRSLIGNNFALDDAGGVRLSNCDSVLRDVTISGNGTSMCYPSQCGFYGGASIGGGTVSLVRCTISGNAADFIGGIGIGTNDTAITDSQVIGNYSEWGVGGMSLWGPAVVEGTTIASNEVGEGWSGGCQASGQVEFYDCRIEGNSAGVGPSWGGGLNATASGPTATRCVIDGNFAHGFGGGVAGPFLLTNCTLSGNAVGSHGPVSGGSAAGRSGYAPGFPVLVNCIAFGNEGQALADGVVASYSLIEGGWPGTGNLDADPQFLAGTYNLLSSSPCIDAGDPASPLDLDGSIADMGAFWFSCKAPGTNYCVAAPNSVSPTGATIWASGSSSLAANDLVLMAGPVPVNEFGVFFHAAVQAQVPFGDGFKCAANGIVRLWPATTADGAGIITKTVDGFNWWITSGVTRHFQCWYRDPAGGPAGFNLSDGLSVCLY